MSEDDLLEDIYASPNDDGPRLVYADALTAKGDPRGELIVLQCRLEAAPDDEARRKLKVAENKLLKAHGKVWTSTLPEGVTKYVFRRGFIDELEIDLRLLEQSDALLAAAPLLRSLRLDLSLLSSTTNRISPRPTLDTLLEWKQTDNLTKLDLRLSGLGGDGIKKLAASSRVRNLRFLRASGVSLDMWGDAGPRVPRCDEEAIAAALVHSPSLKNLTHLELSENQLSSRDIAPLGEATWSLESLELASNGIDSEGVRTLARGSFPKLRYLGLAGASIDHAALEALVTSKTLPKLESLDLERVHIGAEGCGVLFAKLALPSLRALRLERNGLGEAGALVIAKSPQAAQLTSLEIGHNRIGKKGAAAFASTLYFAKLERLLLNEPRWKDETIDLFRKSKTLEHCRIYMRGHLLTRA